MSRRWVTLTWTFLQKADGCRIFHQCESHDECKEILRMFANFKEETIHWLGTIHILRKNVLGDFLTHHLCTVSKQKWPISEPIYPGQCLRNVWMALRKYQSLLFCPEHWGKNDECFIQDWYDNDIGRCLAETGACPFLIKLAKLNTIVVWGAEHSASWGCQK